MEETLKLVVETLVDNKDNVSIQKEEENDTAKFTVSVAKDELGKVIGKKGRIAQAIRVLIKSIASKERKMVEIQFVEAE